MAENQPPRRSTLPKHEARQRYVEIGELVVLAADQARLRAARRPLDRRRAVRAARRQRGRGAGRQDARRDQQPVRQPGGVPGRDDGAGAERGRLGRADRVPRPGRLPGRRGVARRAASAAESERGPVHGSEPVVDYGTLWALWLSAVPYGLWSEQVSRPSMEEHVLVVEAVERALGGRARALRRSSCGTTPRSTTSRCALASLVEGVWLNQCLTDRHPTDPGEPIATVAAAVRAGCCGAALSAERVGGRVELGRAAPVVAPQPRPLVRVVAVLVDVPVRAARVPDRPGERARAARGRTPRRPRAGPRSPSRPGGRAPRSAASTWPIADSIVKITEPVPPLVLGP